MTDYRCDPDPNAAPLCPEPATAQGRPSTFEMPAGVVDTHAHVIGEPPLYPWMPNRAYTPPAATSDAYIKMLDDVGSEYGVSIQKRQGSWFRIFLRSGEARRLARWHLAKSMNCYHFEIAQSCNTGLSESPGIELIASSVVEFIDWERLSGPSFSAGGSFISRVFC
jgi:hypothetical protein